MRAMMRDLHLESARDVPITPAWRKNVRQIMAQIRHMVERQEMPGLPMSQARCVSCEFRRFL